MLSPIQFVRNDLQKAKKTELISPLIVFLTLLYLLIFGSKDLMACQGVTFSPKLPQQEYLIPWKIERLIFKGSAFQNEIVNYAMALGGKDFVHTIVSENGTLDPMRKSDIVGVNGYRDRGICQLNPKWHSAFINSPDFKDWRKQVRYCLEVYKHRPTAFNGYNVRKRALKSFL